MPGSESISVPSRSNSTSRRVPASARHARASSAATAGSSLPSRNSRNAPPPVEMYEILSSTPYFSIAASVSPPPAIENALESAIARASVFGAVAERVELEHADRPVPDHRAGLRDQRGVALRGLGADVEDHVAVADRIGALHASPARRP